MRFDSRHPLHTRKALQQKRIREFPFCVRPAFRSTLGHFGPHISTPRHSPFSFRGRSACPVVFSGPANLTKSFRRNNYEIDMNGVNYVTTKKPD